MIKENVNAMPPKLEDGSPSERIQIIAPQTWVARIEEWRRKQPKIPTKSEAIRLLVDAALTADEK